MVVTFEQLRRGGHDVSSIREWATTCMDEPEYRVDFTRGEIVFSDKCAFIVFRQYSGV